MNERINTVVSFGIGAWDSVRTNATEILKNLETEVNALIASGESVQSENAVKVRSAVSQASSRLTTFIEATKVQSTALSEKAQKTLSQLEERAKALMAKLPGRKEEAV